MDVHKGRQCFLVMLPTQRLMLHARSLKGILNCSFVPFMFGIIHPAITRHPGGQLQSVTEDSFSEGVTDHLCLRENYDYFFLICHHGKARGT